MLDLARSEVMGKPIRATHRGINLGVIFKQRIAKLKKTDYFKTLQTIDKV